MTAPIKQSESFVCEVFQLNFLGAMEVRVGTTPIAANAWQRSDAKRLLCALALKQTHRASRDDLCQQLFCGLDKSASRSKLTNTLYSLRKALGNASERIVASATTIELKWDHNVRWDVDRFERCLDSAACCADTAERAEELEQALSLYRGELLEGMAIEPWFAQDRALLQTRLLWALDELVAVYSSQERLSKAIDCQRQRVEIEGGTQEQANHAKLIAMLIEAGRMAEAGAQYKRCRDLLASELGQAPSATIQALYAQIRQHDGDLGAACHFASPASPIQTSRVESTTPSLAISLAAPDPLFAAGSSPVFCPVTLLGRDQDTHAVLTLLLELDAEQTGKLVSLTGLGGVGKTTLARHLMAQWGVAMRALKAAHADRADGAGVCEPNAVFIDASEMATVETLAERLGHALGLPPSLILASNEDVPVDDDLSRLTGLVVVDNYEHLVGQTPILATLRAHCPNVSILVTSRIPLRLEHEHCYPVAPLKIATDAVALFVKRAQARNPKLRFDSETLDVVTTICSRLDGLPLAIELAAARSRLFPPRELLARLTVDLKLLHTLPVANTVATTAKATMLNNPIRAAHGSLWEILNWTVNLLSAKERALLVCLDVFQGGFTLSAVEAVFAQYQNDSDGTGTARAEITETTDLFERLIDHQLIVPMERLPWVDLSRLDELDDPGQDQYPALNESSHAPQHAEEQRWMMLETVKQFVSSELATAVDPDREANIAHARHYLNTMAALIHAHPQSNATSFFLTHESSNLLASFDSQFPINPQATLDPLLSAMVLMAHRGSNSGAIHAWIIQLRRAINCATVQCSPSQQDMLDVVEMFQFLLNNELAKSLSTAQTILARFCDGETLTVAVIEACGIVYFASTAADDFNELSETIRRCDAIRSQLRASDYEWIDRTAYFHYLLFSLARTGRFAEYADVERSLLGVTLTGDNKRALLDCGATRSSKRGDWDDAKSKRKELRAEAQLRQTALSLVHTLFDAAMFALDQHETTHARLIIAHIDKITGLPLAYLQPCATLTNVMRHYINVLDGASKDVTLGHLGGWSDNGWYLAARVYWYVAATARNRNIAALTACLGRLLAVRPQMTFLLALRFLETLGGIAVLLHEREHSTTCFLMSQEAHDRSEFLLSAAQHAERIALGVPTRLTTDSTVYRDMSIEMFSARKFWQHIEPTVKALHQQGKLLVASQADTSGTRLATRR